MDPNTRALMMGAAGSGGAEKIYIEDTFSTFLYTGNGSTQTITNGIDLSGKGGLVWFKQRNSSSSHELVDTARGVGKGLDTRTDGAQTSLTDLTSFTSSGFSLGYNTGNANFNTGTFASWTFRKQAKFFDVVTYTGTGSNRTIAHSLGSVPGCIIVKRTDTTGDWQLYHRSLANTEYMVLNSSAAKATGATRWNSTTPTSTEFSLGTDATVNASGGIYVAYLFAHDAGGFGDSGNESVVKCGSFVTTSGGRVPAVDLGWEPQWILIKDVTQANNWIVFDTMRGLSYSGNSFLQPNTSNAESSLTGAYLYPTATGFEGGLNSFLLANDTHIYIAIRRGPMKAPTDATKVFLADAGTNGTSGDIVTTGFPVDMDMTAYRSLGGVANVEDRIRGYGTANAAGNARNLITSSATAELTVGNPYFYNAWNATITRGSNGVNPGGAGIISYFFRRAFGFLDVVAYTGTSNSLPQTISHNLGVKPEMMIVKRRDATSSYGWHVWHSTYEVVGGSTSQHALLLNTTGAIASDAGWWNQTSPTSAGFTVGDRANMLNATFIAYLFASCPGVSKVGSYTGTGTTLSVDCGFTNGARFVLIKRTDSTGDWYIWDTARGIVAANDPYLLLNSNAAEVTNTDYIDPLSSGFQISSTAPAAINANSGTFIYLAIA